MSGMDDKLNGGVEFLKYTLGDDFHDKMKNPSDMTETEFKSLSFKSNISKSYRCHA
jgi:hypothetical protein